MTKTYPLHLKKLLRISKTSWSICNHEQINHHFNDTHQVFIQAKSYKHAQYAAFYLLTINPQFTKSAFFKTKLKGKIQKWSIKRVKGSTNWYNPLTWFRPWKNLLPLTKSIENENLLRVQISPHSFFQKIKAFFSRENISDIIEVGLELSKHPFSCVQKFHPTSLH